MKLELNPSYKPALLFGVCLQVPWVAFVSFCSHILPFGLIPAAAYLFITPIIIFRHPQPTTLDLMLVRSGYFFYWALLFLVALAFAAIHR